MRAFILGLAALTALFGSAIASHGVVLAQEPPLSAIAGSAAPIENGATGGVKVTEETARRLFGNSEKTNEPGQEVSADVDTFSGGDLLNLIVRLVAVAGVIYVSLWALKRWMQRRGGPTFVGGRIRVLETMGLAAQRLLYVIDVGDRLLLVGATPQQLTLIAELTDDETITAFRNGAGNKPAVTGPLQDILSHFRGSSHQKGDSAPRDFAMHFRALLGKVGADSMVSDSAVQLTRATDHSTALALLRARNEELQRRASALFADGPYEAEERATA